MKTLILTLLFFFNTAQPDCDNLSTIRNIFQAGVDEKQLNEMILLCQQSDCYKITPYHAAATMKKAEFGWSPLKKLTYFNTGKKMLDDFIKKYPNNIEARYIRWLTQKMAPGFLGYDGDIEEDYNYIMQNIHSNDMDEDYKKTILEHIKKVANE
ncbi:hypothetical protein ACXGQW_02625 [Wenyingzhuangia sp. IMCC45533]